MHFVPGGLFSEQAQDDAFGVRHEGAHHRELAAFGGLRTENAVRHVMPRLDDPLDLVGAEDRLPAGLHCQGVHAGVAIRLRGRVRHGRCLPVARRARALVIKIGPRIAGHG
jgi:hypothetical protein